MVANLICELEKKIRNMVIHRGIRTSEFFLDFDKGRSGFVTASQFFRILNTTFGLTFTCEEQQAFLNAYQCGRHNMVNYKLFCESINKPFDPKKFAVYPYCQTRWHCFDKLQNKCWYPDLQPRLDDLLKKLHKFYSCRGLSLYDLCRDYDHLREGRIHETQFYKSFVEPKSFTKEDIILIIQKYQDPEISGMIRYVDLVNDLKAFDKPPMEKSNELRNISCCKSEEPMCKDLQCLLEELCEVVYKHQIRCADFFKDYDPLRTGAVSVTQFMSALDLCIGHIIKLSEEEKALLWQGYLLPDGKICYREFCSLIDDAFLESNLEKKPTKDVEVVVPGTFGRRVSMLSPEEEECLDAILERIRKELDFRRTPLTHFFKNFEHHGLNLRFVTRTQFSRVLDSCNINVQPQDLCILCKKFGSPNSDLINYPAFIEMVDSLTQVERHRDAIKIMSKECRQDVRKECQAKKCVELDVSNLRSLLRNHIIVYRVRVKEFFQDFDGLRTGKITKSQFKRSLLAMGCGSIHGGLNFTSAQLDALADAYAHPQNPCSVCWIKFVEDLEAGFSDKYLEKKPCHKLRPMSDFVISKLGTMNVDVSSEEHKQRFEKTMCKIGSKLREQNIDLLQIFKTFDKLRHGHISRTKFRQALGIADLACCDELDMLAVEAVFYNNEGINFMAFLEHLDNMHHKKDINEVNKKAHLDLIRGKQQNIEDLECCSKHPKEVEDLQKIMLRFKLKLTRENFRVVDWFKTYDKLNTGYIGRSNFRRALDQCRFDVYGNEISLLEDFLKSHYDPNMIDYIKFSEELESIFAIPNLEKTPTKDVELFCQPSRFCVKYMTPKEEGRFNTCMEKIINRYKILRPHLHPFLKDFDKVNTGSVSKSQFRRALEELGLASEMTSETVWNILYKKFAIQVGGREDVDYLSFSNWLESRSKMPHECVNAC